MASDKIPFKQAIGYVLLSVVIIWGTVCMTWWYQSLTLTRRENDPHYQVNAIIQTAKGERLSTWQLAEILDLSKDRPQNLYLFDIPKAEKKLSETKVFKKAHVRKIRPNMLHIDYELREPRFLITDFENLACDAEGYCFPLMPFFSPKTLPEVYIGISEIPASQLKTRELDLVFEILEMCEGEFVERIDTHSAYAPSSGGQEIVLVLKHEEKRQFLRLTASDYKERFQDYLALRKKLESQGCIQERIVDLRCPKIALIKTL